MTLWLPAAIYTLIATLCVIATILEGSTSAESSNRLKIEGLLLALFWPALISVVLIQANLNKKDASQNILAPELG